MTDLEKFIDTYKQFGIDVKPFKYDDNIMVVLNGTSINSTESDKFEGYGFFFTKEGKFLKQGFWE